LWCNIILKEKQKTQKHKLNTTKNFMFKDYKSDLKASVILFLVALPLCLGIALAQNAPLFSGIISGIIGGIVVASISGSKFSISGPAAGLTSVVLTSVTQLGTFEAFLLSLCFAGIIQVILGILRAGFIGYYFPTAVIKGMLSGIGIILVLKQIPHLLGYDKNIQGNESFKQADGENSFTEFTHLLSDLTMGPAIIGLISISILLLWQTKFVKEHKLLSKMPSALLIVLLGIIINLLFINFIPSLSLSSEHLVNLPTFDSLGGFFNSFTHPDFTALNNPKVYEVALIIATIASLETLLSLEAVDKLDPNNQISPTNRELIAQGTGNFLCGLVGGLPITSVIVRSSVNVSSGAKSQLSSILHGVLFLLAIFIFPDILRLIPLSCLAAILIITGYNLFKPQLYKLTFKQGLDQFIPFIITVVIMLFTDLLKGVTVGIIFSIFFILKQNNRAPFKFIKEEIEGRMNVFIKLSQNITFINKGKFIEVFKSIPVGAVVYIDGGRLTFIDKDVLEIIHAFKKSSKIKNIEVHLEEIEDIEF